MPNLMDIDRLTFDEAARTRLRSEWQAGPDTFVVGCLSRLQRRKRIDVAIDAMAELEGTYCSSSPARAKPSPSSVTVQRRSATGCALRPVLVAR